VFRNGAFEAVAPASLEPGHKTHGQGLYKPGQWFKYISKYIDAQKNLGLRPPVILAITILGVGGGKLYWQAPNDSPDESRKPFDRDVIALPEVIIQDFACGVKEILRPTFDVLWQAAGVPACPYYAASEGEC